MTARQKILQRLAHASGPVALHELDLKSVSQTSASARLREMARECIVKSVRVPGKRYTAWKLSEVSDYSRDQPQAGRRLLKELDKQMIQDVAECEELGIPYWVKGE